jgi:2-haloacid dehalogenase
MRFDAYLFDVQGTLLDFYTPVSSAVADHLGEVGRPDVDPGDFTRAWRKDYFSRVSTLDQLSGVWQKVQGQYEAGFATVAESYGLPTPDAAIAEQVAASWQRLLPWPDVRGGLAAIRDRALTATLSNTDMATVIGFARTLDLRFDAYFTAELFRRFKPDPQVYLGALKYLGIEPTRAALVASHPYDLDAAAALGLGTVFVERPNEYGDPALAHCAEAGRYTQVVTGVDQVE